MKRIHSNHFHYYWMQNGWLHKEVTNYKDRGQEKGGGRVQTMQTTTNPSSTAQIAIAKQMQTLIAMCRPERDCPTAICGLQKSQHSPLPVICRQSTKAHKFFLGSQTWWELCECAILLQQQQQWWATRHWIRKRLWRCLHVEDAVNEVNEFSTI